MTSIRKTSSKTTDVPHSLQDLQYRRSAVIDSSKPYMKRKSSIQMGTPIKKPRAPSSVLALARSARLLYGLPPSKPIDRHESKTKSPKLARNGSMYRSGSESSASIEKMRLQSQQSYKPDMVLRPDEYMTPTHRKVKDVQVMPVDGEKEIEADSELWDVDWKRKYRMKGVLLASIREHIADKRMHARFKACVINPHGNFRRTWDVIMLVMLIYLTVVTPFQICFMYQWSIDNIQDWWPFFMIDRIIDLYFFCDIIINFRVAYENHEGVMIFDACVVARRYILGWFFVDLISTIPFEIVEIISNWIIAANPDSSSNEASATMLNLLRVNKMFKMMRLAKLLKVTRTSRMFARWERWLVLKVRYGVQRIVRFMIILLVVLHWLACFLGFIGHWEADEMAWRYSWMDTTWESIKLNDLNKDKGHTIATSFELYVACFYWAATTVTTIGYGDTQPVTTLERIYFIFSMLIGAYMFSFLIGNICQILSNLNVDTLEFQYKMDCVNRFMSKYKISNPVRVRANEYCFHLQQSELSLSESMKGSIKHFLSDPILKDICLEIHGDVLRKIEFFRRAESEDFLREVALKLQNNTRLFGPNEFIFEQGEKVDEMYILYSGRVQMEDWSLGKVDCTRICSGPEVLGENFILFDDPASESAHTMSFCETAILRREVFVKTLERFPSCIEKVRMLTVQRLWKQFFHTVVSTPREEIELLINQSHSDLSKAEITPEHTEKIIPSDFKSGPEKERRKHGKIHGPMQLGHRSKSKSAILNRSRSGFFKEDDDQARNHKIADIHSKIAIINAHQSQMMEQIEKMNRNIASLMTQQNSSVDEVVSLKN